MPELKDIRREEFARLVASGVGQTDAYERAGFKRNRGGAWRMLQREDVRARVAELRAERKANLPVPVAPVELTPLCDNPQTLREMGYTKAWFADAYRRVAAAAEEGGQYGQCVSALSKIQGMYEAEVTKEAADPTRRPPTERIDINALSKVLSGVADVVRASKEEPYERMQEGTPTFDGVHQPTMKAIRAAEDAD